MLVILVKHGIYSSQTVLANPNNPTTPTPYGEIIIAFNKLVYTFLDFLALSLI